MAPSRPCTRRASATRALLEAVYQAMSAGSANTMLVCEVEREPIIVGAAQLQQLAPLRCQHVGVSSIGVHRSAQQVGASRALMVALIAHARSFGPERLELYVHEDNARARALYASLGFVQKRHANASYGWRTLAISTTSS